MQNFIDKFFDSTKIIKTIFALLVVILFIVIFNLNRHTPLIVDDYAMIGSSGSYSDIFNFLYNQYFTWGGRTVAHFFALISLGHDKMLFNVVNAFFYIALVLLIHFHAVGRLVLYPAIILFVNFAFFMFVPVFGQNFLWLDGACNYLWTIVIALLFLLPYRLQIEKTEPLINSKPLFFLIFLIGIIAGWSNENLAVSLILTTFLCVLINKKINNSFNKWEIYGFCGTTIGGLLLLLAPGNLVRMKLEAGGQHIDVILNFFNINELFLDRDFLFFPVYIAILLLFLAKKNIDIKEWLRKERVICFYFFLFLISMYAMLGSPYFTERARLASLIFIVMLICYLYTRLDFSDFRTRRVIVLTVIVLFLWLHSLHHDANRDVKAYELRENARIEYILQEKSKGNLNPVIEKNHPDSKYCAAWGLGDITNDKNDWLNNRYAWYYGVESVRTR